MRINIVFILLNSDCCGLDMVCSPEDHMLEVDPYSGDIDMVESLEGKTW
jgi:hypothetical protein